MSPPIRLVSRHTGDEQKRVVSKRRFPFNLHAQGDILAVHIVVGDELHARYLHWMRWLRAERNLRKVNAGIDVIKGERAGGIVAIIVEEPIRDVAVRPERRRDRARRG